MNGKLFQTCPLISLLRRQLPPKGEAFGNPYKPSFVILSEAKDLKTPASTTTMRIVGYRCCKILQSLRSLRMTGMGITLPLKFKCHFPPPGNRATIMTL